MGASLSLRLFASMQIGKSIADIRHKVKVIIFIHMTRQRELNTLSSFHPSFQCVPTSQDHIQAGFTQRKWDFTHVFCSEDRQGMYLGTETMLWSQWNPIICAQTALSCSACVYCKSWMLFQQMWDTKHFYIHVCQGVGLCGSHIPSGSSLPYTHAHLLLVIVLIEEGSFI